MNLRHIRTFVVVYQERSVTAAAERLNGTQSSLSMQLKDLEEYLGVQLLDRSPRGVTPTAAGDRFYAYAVSLVSGLNDVRDEMRAMAGKLLGSVRFGVIPTLSRAVLSRALRAFTLRHPDVKLHAVEAYSAPLTESVAREELDFALVPMTVADARVRAEPVASDREFLVTGGGTARANLAPLRIRDVSPLRLIVPSAGNARRARIEAYLARTGAQAEALLEMDAMMATLELIAVSDWMAILPAALCYSDLDGRARKAHPLVDPTLSVEYALITPAARTLNPPARALSAAIVEHIRGVTSECEALVGHQGN